LKEHESELRELDPAVSTWKQKLDDAPNDLDVLKRLNAAEEVKGLLRKGEPMNWLILGVRVPPAFLLR